MNMPLNRDTIRWLGCFALVLFAHVGCAYAILNQRQELGDVSDASSTLLIDFTAPPIPDAPERDIAAGIEQVQTEAAPPPSEAKPETVAEAEKEPNPQKPVEIKPQETVRPVQSAEEPIPTPPLPAVDDAAVTLPPVASPPPVQSLKQAEDSKEKSELQMSPALATASETTAPTSATMRSASLVTWKTTIARHLQRFKRYPAGSSERGEYGAVELSFTVDRKGQVIAARIRRESGFSLLDEEALAMVRRAQPLPRPPGDVVGSEFNFTVPVKFIKK